jgi:prophage antirepressor-like protein
MGRNQKVTIINEPGVYELIIRSDKPQARPFRRWVTKEVLPDSLGATPIDYRAGSIDHLTRALQPQGVD